MAPRPGVESSVHTARMDSSYPGLCRLMRTRMTHGSVIAPTCFESLQQCYKERLIR